MPLCNNLSSVSSEKLIEEECEPCGCLSDLSIIDSTASGFVHVRSRTQILETSKPPNIAHEVNVAKSLMQQGSGITGDNLFDHLADLIKRVLDARPPNIVDYFEEFSFNVRAQKFRIAERFPWSTYEQEKLEEAKSVFKSLKLHSAHSDIGYDVCEINKSRLSKKRSKSASSTDASPILDSESFQRRLLLNENVLRLHLYWALCGFGLQSDEVLRLAYSLQKIQFHPTIEHARFWGKIYGIRKSYYIVEAKLTQLEIEKRLEKMKEEMMEKMMILRGNSEQNMLTEVSADLIPGVHWQDQPEEELKRMQRYSAKPIPQIKIELQFDIPPEAVGTGLNRRAYFVVNSLEDEWIELPIVTPKQLQVSRKIKKFLSGDLEADIVSYPNFPGTEKHYLRTMIARITSGTYIAPDGYYRRLTKRETMEALGEELDLDEEEMDGEEEEEELENDAIIVENSDYEPAHRQLMASKSWVHVRPNILEQGRVVYFDEDEARKALEREAMLRLRGEEEDLQEEEENEEEEEEEENEPIEEDDTNGPRGGPALFTPCSTDRNDQNALSWTPRYSSVHNKVNQLIMLRSNLWPGAFSFTFEKYCDSIYLGWGCKYTARNMLIPQLTPIQDDYDPDDNEEKIDPTVEMEQAWEIYLRKKQLRLEEYDEEEEEEEAEPDEPPC